ncbi:MAG: ParB/RepB/Spo0J family partition protein [Deltaproteobacteria bacterium]|nr:ParB/RepB/Spo0J family partition protein [Deltaproteobacteria bacterium]
MAKKQALGRGLDALIPDMKVSDLGPSEFFLCDIDLIRPNPYQPRRTFSKQELKGLTDSIKRSGVLQPLVVRQASTGYDLIVGERRWRSARMAGLKQVPVVVKEVSNDQMLEMALVENIQREDLNPLEKAHAYQRLMDEFGLTQEKIARRVGQDRSTVANFLRLLGLPKEIQDDIVDRKLSMGHARALLGVQTAAQQKAVWKQVVSQGLSVRSAEALVRKLRAGKTGVRRPKTLSSDEIYFRSLAEELTHALGTKVRIVRKGRKEGTVEISFYGNDDLDRLVKRIKDMH